jgi:hypothetical protein
MTEIMTPDSIRWETFVCMLEMALNASGCDAKTHQHAKKILADMGNVNIEESIDFFEEHGGYCDCEILLNVEPW